MGMVNPPIDYSSFKSWADAHDWLFLGASGSLAPAPPGAPPFTPGPRREGAWVQIAGRAGVAPGFLPKGTESWLTPEGRIVSVTVANEKVMGITS